MNVGTNPYGPGMMGAAPMGAPGGGKNFIQDGFDSMLLNKQVANGELAMMGKSPIAMDTWTSSAGAGFGSGLTQVVEGVAKGGAYGAGVGALVSAVENGIKVFKKQETLPQAGGAVAADTATGAVSGLVGAVASGTTMALMAGIAGVAGAGLALVGGLVGVGAFLGAGLLFKKSPFYQQIRDKVTQLLGGTPVATASANPVGPRAMV